MIDRQIDRPIKGSIQVISLALAINITRSMSEIPSSGEENNRDSSTPLAIELKTQGSPSDDGLILFSLGSSSARVVAALIAVWTISRKP